MKKKMTLGMKCLLAIAILVPATSNAQNDKGDKGEKRGQRGAANYYYPQGR